MLTNGSFRRFSVGTALVVAVCTASVAVGQLPVCNGNKIAETGPNKYCGTAASCPAYSGQNPNCAGVAVIRQAEIAKCIGGGSPSQHCVDNTKNPPLYCTKSYNCKREYVGPGFVYQCTAGTARLGSDGKQVGSFDYPGTYESCRESDT